jgi:hypothetical protein
MLFYTASVGRAFCLVYLFSKEDPVESIFLMKLEHEHQDNYDETVVYSIYVICVSHNYRTLSPRHGASSGCG